MQGIRLMALLAIVVLAGAACASDNTTTDAPTPASASTMAASTPSTSSEASTEIRATSTSAAPTIGDPICDAGKHCLYPLTVTATLSGDLTGTWLSHSAGALFGSDFAAGSTDIYTGKVAGCGTGTMVIVGIGRGSTAGKSSGTWEIFKGLGTGDLARVAGSGTSDVRSGTNGKLAETLTGHITCE